ncbi:MAG TPA: hypothetical protein VG078_06640 [Acidimicrobiales bacterium]|nr:hypothetical protein [Acidimicrobiales bacterium]
MRILVLVDGEHHPPVVRAAIDHLPSRLPGGIVVGAAVATWFAEGRTLTPVKG